MLNTQKLLYILPDLAYLAELLPGKKEHTYQVHSFKQFNGELIRNGKFIQENIQSLMKKLEEDEYHIILPDEIFTNTIINAEKGSEKEVKDYLKEEVIPSLHISSESHQIETFILSEFRGIYKVQLSTIQKSLLAPLKAAAQEQKVYVKSIYPLSWVIKSLISLEPSLSILQIGEHLYMAKHYIGVDEPLADSIDNLDRVVEAIKTLKGVESSLQTVYLLTSEAVEDSLKEKLDKILPLQQLAQATKEDSKVPGYLDKIVTSSMRTISIPDFEIPQFGLKDVDASQIILTESKPMTKQVTDLKISTESLSEAIESNEGELEGVVAGQDLTDLPKPATLSLDSESVEQETLGELQEEVKPEIIIQKEQAVEEDQASSDLKFEDLKIDDSKEEPQPKKEEKNVIEPEQSDDIDLSKFISSTSLQTEAVMPKLEEKKKVLKNNDGTGSFLKVFLIGLGSFILTVAIGVGIGAGLLKLSQPSTQPAEEPLVEWSETDQDKVEEPEEPEETEEEVIEIDRSQYSIRVVNATTKAGYAGEIAKKLKVQDFKKVDAKNAVESYDEGNFVIMNEENADLIITLSEDLGFELAYLEGTEAEDPNQEYDAIVVLAE